MNLSIKDGKSYQELEMEVLLNEFKALKISIEKKEKRCNEILLIIERLKQIK